MAPMRLLCSSVLRSLILREGPTTNLLTDPDVDDVEEDPEPASDSDSADETFKKRTPKIPSLKSSQQSTKIRKQNLQSVLTESLDWTRVLMD